MTTGKIHLSTILLLFTFWFQTTIVHADDTYSSGSGDWGTIGWTNGIPLGGDNVFISSGDIVTIANLAIDFHITIIAGGELRVASNVTSANWNYSIANNGTLSVGNTLTTEMGLALTNSDSIYVGSTLTIGQSTVSLNSNSVLEVGNGSATSNGDLTIAGSAKLRIDQDFSIGTTSGPITNNAGEITVGGDFLSNNGTFSNELNSSLIVGGTAEFKNGSSSSNIGLIDVTGLFTIQSGDLTNSIGAVDGYLLARGGLLTKNGGCVKGGKLDHIGLYDNQSGCDMLANNVQLPVELTSFTASPEGRNIVLEWETKSETNNSEFQIEHAYSQTEFAKIGSISGSGTTSQATKYRYTHRDVDIDISYYRLKQVDFDNSYSYTKTIAVYANSETAEFFDVINSNTEYLISHNGLIGLELQILDTGGKLLYSTILSDRSIQIPVSSLPNGIKLFKAGKFCVVQN